MLAERNATADVGGQPLLSVLLLEGLLPGAVHVGLDITPVVGTAKNVIEIFTGDWIPDKPSANGAAVNTPQLASNNPQLKAAGS